MRLFQCSIPLPHSMRLFLNLLSQRGPCVRKAAQARTGFWIRCRFGGAQKFCGLSATVLCGQHSPAASTSLRSVLSSMRWSVLPTDPATLVSRAIRNQTDPPAPPAGRRRHFLNSGWGLVRPPPAACEQPHHEAGHTTAPDHMRYLREITCIDRGVHTRLTAGDEFASQSDASRSHLYGRSDLAREFCSFRAGRALRGERRSLNIIRWDSETGATERDATLSSGQSDRHPAGNRKNSAIAVR